MGNSIQMSVGELCSRNISLTYAAVHNNQRQERPQVNRETKAHKLSPFMLCASLICGKACSQLQTTRRAAQLMAGGWFSVSKRQAAYASGRLAFRRLCPFAATPAKRVPSNSIVVGSGVGGVDADSGGGYEPSLSEQSWRWSTRRSRRCWSVTSRSSGRRVRARPVAPQPESS